MVTIGIFDSGIGGLSLVEACEKAIPGARVLYVADTAHQPYGQKTAGQVLEYARRIGEFFQAQGVQAILVACSTASAVAVPALQQKFTLPIFGLLNEVWVGETLKATRNGRIGILATTLTTQTGVFVKALERKAHEGIAIFGMAAPALIGLISEGKLEGEILIPETRRAMKGLLDRNIDTLVVGCTHFNFILPQLKRVAGEGIQIVNPRDSAVKVLADFFSDTPLKQKLPGAFYVTGDLRGFQELVRTLWRADAVFQPLELVHA